MSEYGYINTAQRIQEVRDFETTITLGEVIDTNDPLQMGRLRVYCAGYGDSAELPVTSLPWASYASPFGGVNDSGSRGRGDDQTTGPVAYGMWNIPKVGSHVLVGCIDGDPSARFWFASIYPNFLTHTLPHGRFFDTDKTGPLSSTEDPIQPLNTNQETAFGPRALSFEWQTRGADKQAAFLNREFINIPQQSEVSEKADERTQGYAPSRVEPDLTNSMTAGVNWDPQTYSWTTPGFHAISMEDRKDNCRIRIRSTGGHQIIMDDTNERIYISTSEGKTWIEIDEKGTIDIYGSKGVSIRSDADINMSAKGMFRVAADAGIHMSTGGEFRTFSTGDTNIRTNSNINMYAAQNTSSYSGAGLKIHSITDMSLETNATFNMLAGNQTRVTSGATMHLLSGGQMFQTATQIHQNGPAATSATPAGETQAKGAYSPSRIPGTVSVNTGSTPASWARSYTDQTATDVDATSYTTIDSVPPEYTYSDPNVAKQSNRTNPTIGSFNRNPLWKR